MLKKVKMYPQASFSAYGIAISSITVCSTQYSLFTF